MIFGGKKKVNRNESSLDSIREKTDLAVDVENLVVKYKTSEATVEAVNSISLKVKKKRLWVLWERPEREKPQPCWR